MDTMTRNHLPFDPDQDKELDEMNSAEDLSPEAETPPVADAAGGEDQPKQPDAPPADAEPTKGQDSPAPEQRQERQDRAPTFAVPAEKLDEVTAKLGEIDSARDKLAQQYEDGSIDFREYDRRTRELNSSQVALQAEQIKAGVYSDMARQQQQAHWDAAVKAFYGDAANAAFASPALQSLLAAELKAMWERPEVAGRDYLSVLNDAKGAVQNQLRAAMGIESQQAGKRTEEQKPTIDAAVIPKTLGAIPAARANSTGGEFAHLDSMNEIDLENEMRRMSRDQIERYLAA